MLRRKLLFVSCTIFLVLFSAAVTSQETQTCKPSSCGAIYRITHPFRLKDDPLYCGNAEYELACEKNLTVLYLQPGKYIVQEINYENSTIRISDFRLQKNNCSSMPLYSLSDYSYSLPNLSQNVSYYIHKRQTSVTFLNCENQVTSSSCFVSTSPCMNGGFSSLKRQYYSYVVVGRLSVSELPNLCSVVTTTWIMPLPKKDYRELSSYLDIHNELVYGFEISWVSSKQGLFSLIFEILYYAPEYLGEVSATSVVFMVLARTLCGSPCIFAFLVYKWQRRHYSMYDRIEEFLHKNDNLMPIRYSYANIRKMTKGFQEKLGEGGFGSVYKGKLRSGRLVAVKMLGKAKANGQEFINEVATIGRIHHVNVVQLIGYCAEGTKRALLYEFMPNGSLEKYIFHHGEGNISLSCKIIYEISLGVARGIEYLHRGCDMQILHFDIKPHNILLDENFTPKVSDFGLAKLYSTEDSIVNLTAARGTMGYMAPELFYQNIGGVSYKADVYSFGMLLMEMASKRKNLNAFAEHSSQIYFPSWVYDQFSEGKDIEMGDATEEEREITQKMVIVALWCIQMKPSDRPSMSKVVAMLEGNVELQMPPKPLLYPQQMSTMVHAGNDNPESVPASSHNAMDTEPLVGR